MIEQPPAPRRADRARSPAIALTFAIVVIVGLLVVGPKFLSFGNITIIGSFLVGADDRRRLFAGFALLAGVVDLSIGSMLGFSSALFAAADRGGLDLWLGDGA